MIVRDRPPETTVTMVLGGAMGVLLLVIGLVALARVGMGGGLTEATASVGPFTRTALGAILEIVFGLLVLMAAVTIDKGTLTGVGFVGIVLGLVWIIEPNAFQDILGAGQETGLLYLIVGIVALVAGFVGHRYYRRSSTVIERDTYRDDHREPR